MREPPFGAVVDMRTEARVVDAELADMGVPDDQLRLPRSPTGTVRIRPPSTLGAGWRPGTHGANILNTAGIRGTSIAMRGHDREGLSMLPSLQSFTAPQLFMKNGPAGADANTRHLSGIAQSGRRMLK